MALKLQSYKFMIISCAFIYPKGTKEEDRENITPEYLKFSGFVDYNGEMLVCHIFDKFSEFGKTKNEIKSLTMSRSCISGQGICKLDNNYNYSLQLSSYEFGKYFWTFDIGTKEFKD